MTSIDSQRTRDLTSDDLDAVFDVRTRSFGPLNPSMRDWWNEMRDWWNEIRDWWNEIRDWWNDIQHESIKERRAIGVFDGERLLAHAKVRSYQQFWGGRSMPMGGIAGVVVTPRWWPHRTLGGEGVPLRAATESDLELFRQRLHDGYAAQRANGPRRLSEADAKEQITGDGMMSYVTH
ncbi:MAG: GNAT family N-acetyltransferase [Dermatophilaceae bacterium]